MNFLYLTRDVKSLYTKTETAMGARMAPIYANLYNYGSSRGKTTIANYLKTTGVV